MIGSRRSFRLLGASLIVLAAVALFPVAPAATAQRVIVRATSGLESAAVRAIEAVGGTVGLSLGIINGFAATVPADEVPALASAAGIDEITPDAEVRLMNADDAHATENGSMQRVADAIGARALWDNGITGEGVDVALIDSGVVPVEGLTTPDKVINGPDISFDSQSPRMRHLDAFGHGTHMAGIIAGRDAESGPGSFSGIAPGARILNVKVANAVGATDVSQVIAAIDWVVQHRTDNGLNVRVLNLAFGTDSLQDYVLDPLAYAAEVAWRKGIVVVVAAGNEGETRIGLSNPAFDPYLIAVGANDANGTPGVDDDSIPAWSGRGDGIRNPDVVAPGRSVVSLRDPDSYIDHRYPEARVGERFFKGSGTSQAAAVVSGAAALLLEQRPELTPDQVKALLEASAHPLTLVPHELQGAGLIDVSTAAALPAPIALQAWPASKGTGSLEDARGSLHVELKGKMLRGEKDIFGKHFKSRTWAGASWSGASWSGGTWNGSDWTGSGWSGASWSGASWSGASWSGASWSGASWSGASWSGASWSGASWSGASWSGASWSGSSWYGASWSGASWSGASWSTSRWE
ncbi:MAG TPA: S8 family serine peptidase [Actinomycetota bacterium]|nr:S8 family serine peptidase [Actinomycetota bacterium]